MSKKVNLTTCKTDTHHIENLICQVAMLWRRLLNSKIKSLGINGTETRTLLCIARNPGLTQIQIANLLDLEPQNLMRSLDKLQALGWIQKRMDANDRRIKCLFITTQAKKTIASIEKISNKVRPHILSEIEESNALITTQQLTKMRENLLLQLESED